MTEYVFVVKFKVAEPPPGHAEKLQQKVEDELRLQFGSSLVGVQKYIPYRANDRSS